MFTALLYAGSYRKNKAIPFIDSKLDYVNKQFPLALTQV